MAKVIVKQGYQANLNTHTMGLISEQLNVPLFHVFDQAMRINQGASGTECGQRPDKITDSFAWTRSHSDEATRFKELHLEMHNIFS